MKRSRLTSQQTAHQASPLPSLLPIPSRGSTGLQSTVATFTSDTSDQRLCAHCGRVQAERRARPDAGRTPWLETWSHPQMPSVWQTQEPAPSGESQLPSGSALGTHPWQQTEGYGKVPAGMEEAWLRCRTHTAGVQSSAGLAGRVGLKGSSLPGPWSTALLFAAGARPWAETSSLRPGRRSSFFRLACGRGLDPPRVPAAELLRKERCRREHGTLVGVRRPFRSPGVSSLGKEPAPYLPNPSAPCL